jgi:hypothetical protein
MEAREASVPSGVKSATMKSAAMERAGMKRAAVESTAAAESAAAVKPAVEPTTAVKTPAPAMGASIGKVRLAESSSEEQSSCHAP